MDLEIIGKSEHCKNSIIKKASAFYDGFLFKHFKNKQINLKIFIVNFPLAESKSFDRSDYGFCQLIFNNHRRYDFTIHINRNLPENLFLKVLAHEMVHMKQYVAGYMKDIGFREVSTKWKYGHYNLKDHKYWYLPWEKEARKYEVIMFEEFLIDEIKKYFKKKNAPN